MLEALDNDKLFEVDDRGYLLAAGAPPKTHAAWRVFGAQSLPKADRMKTSTHSKIAIDDGFFCRTSKT